MPPMALLKLALHDGQLKKVDGDGLLADAMDESHSFDHGDVLARVSGSYVLASNDDAAKWAKAFCYIGSLATATQYGALHLPQIIPWAAHGLGGADGVLWLGTGGAFTTTMPTSGLVVQRLGWILDVNTIMWKPQWPTILA